MKFQTIFFDVDDTLYSKDSGVWQAVRARIEDYMRQRLAIPEDQIPILREHYLQHYGSSLRGLMTHYHIDPEDYLLFVHDVPIETLIKPNPALGRMLVKLPQSKWIFTNSSLAHTQRVLRTLGVQGYFNGVVDIKAMDYLSKPDAASYTLALHMANGLHPSLALFVDDQGANLAPAKNLGAGTVLVGNEPHPAADLQIPRIEDLISKWPALSR